MLPHGAKVKNATRSTDKGYGVDLDFSTDGMVKASIEDDDGDAFFEVLVNNGSCKVDVGSNGLGPGLTVEVYAQKNLLCEVAGVATKQEADYLVTLTAEHQQNLMCDQEDETGTGELCGQKWDSKALSPYWTANIKLPEGATPTHTQHSNDPGHGVELRFANKLVNATAWDTDGDGFFEVHVAGGTCKVAVGSDGPSPGLLVRIFEQNGVDCRVFGASRENSKYEITLATTSQPDGSLNCGAASEQPCKQMWKAE